MQQRGAGDLDWTSPTGRRYHERAPGRVRFTAAEPSGPIRATGQSGGAGPRDTAGPPDTTGLANESGPHDAYGPPGADPF